MMATHAWLATAPCGCHSAIMLDTGRDESDFFPIEQCREGNSVRWLQKDEAKELFLASGGDCPHVPKWGKQQ